jgi:hypothetical protein
MISLQRVARPLALTGLALLMTASAVAQDVTATINRAREFLGRERDLNAINSIRFEGTFQDDRGDSGTIVILFQRPLFHRITLTVGETTDIKALDDYEAWNLTRNNQSPDQWRFRLLDVNEVARMRAVVWENLSFFRGIEQRGGRLEDKGRHTIDGVETQQIDFVHRDDIVFTRFFDRRTGRLVMTRTDDNTEIREEGEIRAGNVRFPQRIISTTKVREIPKSGGDPVEVARRTTITFTSIRVNETFPRREFSPPLFTNLP